MADRQLTKKNLYDKICLHITDAGLPDQYHTYHRASGFKCYQHFYSRRFLFILIHTYILFCKIRTFVCLIIVHCIILVVKYVKRMKYLSNVF